MTFYLVLNTSQGDIIGLDFSSNVETRMEKGIITIIKFQQCSELSQVNRIGIREETNEINVIRVKNPDYRDKIKDSLKMEADKRVAINDHSVIRQTEIAIVYIRDIL